MRGHRDKMEGGCHAIGRSLVCWDSVNHEPPEIPSCIANFKILEPFELVMDLNCFRVFEKEDDI